MRSTAQTVRTRLAALLLAGYGLFWAMWATHPLWAHEWHHHELEGRLIHLNLSAEKHPVIAAGGIKSECGICHFLPVPSDVPRHLDLTLPQRSLPDGTPLFSPILVALNTPAESHLRGPPH